MLQNPTSILEEKLRNFSAVFKDSQAIYVIKDLQSRFLYANPYCLNFLGYKNENCVIGRTDQDFLWSDFSELYQREERATIAGENQVSLVPSLDLAGNDVLFFSTRELITDDKNNPLGILCQARQIKHKSSLELSNLLFNTMPKKEKVKPLYFSRLELVRSLTQTEQECLFFLVRGHSAKMIADRLCRTKKTIEYHVENLKQKFHATSKFDLVTQAIHEGYLYQIPSSLCRKLSGWRHCKSANLAV